MTFDLVKKWIQDTKFEEKKYHGIDVICYSYYFSAMARPLRIEYENAWYHVMNRGARKMPIFNKDDERQLFLDLLQQIHNKFHIEIHAYCLMNNHYHLLIKTPLANLSKAIKYLDGVYVQRYNKFYGIDGPLFRGRFKSIIVDADNYLLRLSRYIHLNPVKSKLIDKAERYQWSSCAAYLGKVKKPDWLQVNQVLMKFGSKLQKQKYGLFLTEGNGEELDSFFNKIKRIPVLGTEAFVTTITEKYLNLNDKLGSLEVPEQNFLHKNSLPKLDRLMSTVARYYQVEIGALKIPIRGKSKPRFVAIYLAARITGESLQVIANNFTNITYSGVSRIAHNVETKLKSDIKLQKEIDNIKNSCF